MNLEGMSKGAKVKGVNLLGSADATHPRWFEALKSKLKPIEGTGLFEYDDVYFMLTAEVGTVYQQEGKKRDIHHLIHAPSFEVFEQINEALCKYGNLEVDGRPILNLTSPELVEILKEISDDIFVAACHIWTPWKSLFGSKFGFDSVEECYQDQTKHIFLLETGLSSDPAMNWRLSSLDKFTLVSNSDSHSPHPWRLAREANVFELEKLTYWEIFDALKKKDSSRFLFTVEVEPSYGKYHFTGHRNCKVSLHPKDAIKLNNICPRCGRKLTVGVLQRVEELADRPEGYVPKNAIPFKTLLPLYEIISFVTGVNQLYSKKVLQEYDKLIAKFGNEFNVLLNVPKEELLKVTNEKIADAIVRVREGRINYIAGYDGVYGKPIFDEKEFEKLKKQKPVLQIQKSLKDFKR
jgi:uncharacterized protein (TIGR00375 family)